MSQLIDLGGDGDANSKKYGKEEKIWKKERTRFKTEEEWTVATQTAHILSSIPRTQV